MRIASAEMPSQETHTKNLEMENEHVTILFEINLCFPHAKGRPIKKKSARISDNKAAEEGATGNDYTEQRPNIIRRGNQNDCLYMNQTSNINLFR